MGEMSGGVEGAGRCVSPLVSEVFAMSWWLYGRFAVMDVKDCEKENTCRPSICVTNSGKKECSCWALDSALCSTAKVRGRNLAQVIARRSSMRLSVQSAMCLAM